MRPIIFVKNEVTLANLQEYAPPRVPYTLLDETTAQFLLQEDDFVTLIQLEYLQLLKERLKKVAHIKTVTTGTESPQSSCHINNGFLQNVSVL